jgi:AcrR family transcriptional regulator
MKPKRRIGNKDSATRAAIVKVTEQLLLQEGYAAVSTRRVAGELGLTGPLIHYYFPTTDDLLVAVYHYAVEQTLARHAAALASKRPLHALWAVCIDPTRTTLALEFMALASHRKAVQVEISRYSEQLRSVQVKGLSHIEKLLGLPRGVCGAAGMSVILVAIARTLVMEESLGIFSGHDEARAVVAWWLDRLESDSESVPHLAENIGGRVPSDRP